MKNFKQILFRMPELYLMFLVLISSFSDKLQLHPIAIGLVVILFLQSLFNNKVLGLIIASLFIVLNLYMLAAVTAEFNEFTTINAEAQKLRAVGLLLFLLNSMVAGCMMYKYLKKEEGALGLLH